jgi:hypothetical protein
MNSKLNAGKAVVGVAAVSGLVLFGLFVTQQFFGVDLAPLITP